MSTPNGEAKDMASENDGAKDMASENDGAKDMASENDGAKDMTAENDGAKDMTAKNDGAKDLDGPSDGAKVMASPRGGTKVMASPRGGTKVMASPRGGTKVMASPRGGTKVMASPRGGTKVMASPRGGTKVMASPRGGTKVMASSRGGTKDMASPRGGTKDMASSRGGTKDMASSKGGTKDMASSKGGTKDMASSKGGTKDMASPRGGTKVMADPSDGTKEMAGPSDGTKVMAGPSNGAKDMSGPSDGTNVMAGPKGGAKDMAGPNDGAKDMAASNEEDEEKIIPNDEGQWSQEDTLNLLYTMKCLLPCQDTTNFKTTESHLDWSKLAFKNYTGSMCRQKWTEISKKVRKFRTLTELIQEAEEHLRNPSKEKNVKKHLKKPLTPYFRFLMDKRRKFAELYPEISNLNLTKILSKKYKELSEEKKMKYIQDFQREKQEYERNLARFSEEYLSLGQSTKKLNIPEKPKTPKQLWFDHKKALHLKLNPDAKTKDVKEALGKKWPQLSDKKRLKWIQKALEQQQLYEIKMRAFIQEHPEVNISEEDITRSRLTKAERKLKDKLDGQPCNLPPNCYAMYSAEQSDDINDVPRAEQTALCSQQWKLQSQQDKEACQKKLEQKKEEYQRELMRFLKNLPEEEQQRVLEEEKIFGLSEQLSDSQVESQDTEKAEDNRGQPEEKTALEETVALPAPPQTAEEFWQQSVIGEYLGRCDNDPVEALKNMEATWMDMQKKDKMIWIKKAAQDYKRYERELRELSKIKKLASAKTTSKKKVKLQKPEKNPVPSSDEQATDIKKNPSKRKSTLKLKGPNPKSRAVSQKTSSKKEDDDNDKKGEDNKSGTSSLVWSSED